MPKRRGPGLPLSLTLPLKGGGGRDTSLAALQVKPTGLPMAALVLSVAGAAAGAVFGPAGAIVGRIAGALVGNIIDKKLFGPGDQNVAGARLPPLARGGPPR